MPRAFVAALEEALTRLSLDDRHRRDALSYVVNGEPASVLTRVGTPARRGMAVYGGGYPLRFPDLYAHLATVPTDVWERWGRLLEAAELGRSWHSPLSTEGRLPSWLEHVVASVYVDPTVPFPPVADIARAGGVEPDVLVDVLLTTNEMLRWSPSRKTRHEVANAPGFTDLLVAHAGIVAERLTTGSVDQRLLACSMVAACTDEQLAVLAPHLAVAATATAAQVRDAARPLLLRVFAAAAPALRDLAAGASGAKPDVRVQALELLWHHGTDDDRAFARTTAAADRAERIRSLPRGWDAPGRTDELADALAVPAAEPIDWRVDVTRDLRDAVHDAVRAYERLVERADAHARQAHANMRARGATVPTSPPRPFVADPALERKLLAGLASPEPPRSVVDGSPSMVRWRPDLAQHPALDAVGVVSVLALTGSLRDGHRPGLGFDAVSSLEGLHARTGTPDALTLQRLLDGLGHDGADVVWRALTSSYRALAREWPAEQVWPFLAANLGHVLAHSRPQEADWETDPAAFYRLVALLPVRPAQLVDHLYSVALGATKTRRPDAQKALRDDPDRGRRVAAALADGKAEVRAVAAGWLAREPDPATLGALETAVDKERNDVAKGAMLDALEALGLPVEAYLDRAALAKDAEKTLARGLPKDLGWLRWESLPPLHWADTGDPVPLPVVQHLVATAAKAKNPEPNAVLRKYAGLLVEAERQAFALALLRAWLAADLVPIDAAEAERQAREQAVWTHSYVQRQPPGTLYGGRFDGLGVDAIAASWLPTFARQPAGSATSSKGVLAVVAAMAGGDVVPPAERYLREWYGQRAAQGRALLGMLGWVDDLGAVQLLLAISSRFRTKSFEVEAARQVEALAEREGWTVAELADRTVPTAGFGADGTLPLSYGERGFTAVLLPDLGLELRTDDGKRIKALPSPRADDDEDDVKAAKAALSAARKELKKAATQQRDRLYEALCTERTWSAADWTTYLAGHPVLRHLCRRLVWVATTPDGDRVVFRPLDDGSLTDLDDADVVLAADATVRLAHDTSLSAEEVEAWQAHLADFEVDPLFEQLGRGLHVLPDDVRDRDRLDDFRGHLLETFALRSRATRLGWTRGATGDGGWFHEYVKRFPSLGLVAVLEFSGNPLPEENRTVALHTFGFVRDDPRSVGQGTGAPVRLGDVPAVLLSEVWQDVRAIAADGTGYDPDWERKSEYR